MRLLILGSNGQLGRCINDQFNLHDFDIICATRKEIDFESQSQIANAILDIRPDIIINCAAYTAVDKAEEEKSLADRINNIAVSNLAKATFDNNSILIHISTDYVFSGTKKTPYTESDLPGPVSIYGKSKYLGELAIKESGCRHLIIRTSGVYSEYGNNFLKTMLNLASDKDELFIVSDQIVTPTYARDIAKAIFLSIPMISRSDENHLFHFSGVNCCSWYQFAKVIFDHAYKLKFINNVPDLYPINTDDYGANASRPVYSCLDSAYFKKEFDFLATTLDIGIARSIKHLMMKGHH